MLENICSCGSGLAYEECCAPYVKGEKHAPDVKSLVRSRYTAFCLNQYEYLVETTHPDFRDDLSVETIREGTQNVTWLRLDLGEEKKTTQKDGETFEQLSFAAYYEKDGIPCQLSETSFFKRDGERLYYVDGVAHKPMAYRRAEPKCGRNASCPCGSGKKYKKCCGAQA